MSDREKVDAAGGRMRCSCSKLLGCILSLPLEGKVDAAGGRMR